MTIDEHEALERAEDILTTKLHDVTVVDADYILAVLVSLLIGSIDDDDKRQAAGIHHAEFVAAQAEAFAKHRRDMNNAH